MQVALKFEIERPPSGKPNAKGIPLPLVVSILWPPITRNGYPCQCFEFCLQSSLGF